MATRRSGSGISHKKLNPQKIYMNRCCKRSRGRPVELYGQQKTKRLR